MATEITKGRGSAARRGSSASEALRDIENAVLADADIFETDDDLTIRIDLPGVEKGKVGIEIDESNTLQVRAQNPFQEPKGAILREWEVADYFRSFRLGEELDKEKISARLEDGVLHLSIPKREEVKPRRIEISA